MNTNIFQGFVGQFRGTVTLLNPHNLYSAKKENWTHFPPHPSHSTHTSLFSDQPQWSEEEHQVSAMQPKIFGFWIAEMKHIIQGQNSVSYAHMSLILAITKHFQTLDHRLFMYISTPSKIEQSSFAHGDAYDFLHIDLLIYSVLCHFDLMAPHVTHFTFFNILTLVDPAHISLKQIYELPEIIFQH